MNFRLSYKKTPRLFVSVLMLVVVPFLSMNGFTENTTTGASEIARQHHGHKHPPSVNRQMTLTTQGPLWPPSDISDENGDFIVLGSLLTEVAPGVIAPVPGAAIVSKNTIPPLDENGVEDFSDQFAVPYKIVRRLDLSEGSDDLNLILHTNSFGPPEGDFGGGFRIPMEGESEYNLGSFQESCSEIFPTESQRFSYKRDSFPLHKAPILGFQGDQIQYDVETNEPFDPFQSTGPGCGTGCSGENNVDERPAEALTLDDWLKGKGNVKITLTGFDNELDSYTSARFDFRFKGLVPNSIYTIWAIRGFFEALPNPLGLPNIVMSDSRGNGKISIDVTNPFPDRSGDLAHLRVIGVALAFHPDFQNWGACVSRLGSGIDVHNQFVSFGEPGEFDITDFITRAAQ